MMTGIEILGIGILAFAGYLTLLHYEDRIMNGVRDFISDLCNGFYNFFSNICDLGNRSSNRCSNNGAQVNTKEPNLDPTKETAEQLRQRSAANPVDQGAALMDGTKSGQGCNLQRRGAAQRKKRLVV